MRIYKKYMGSKLKETCCFVAIKKKSEGTYKKLGRGQKYKLCNTDICLILNERARDKIRWKWFIALKDHFGNILDFEAITPEEIFDDPSVPTEILFHLDLIATLK